MSYLRKNPPADSGKPPTCSTAWPRAGRPKRSPILSAAMPMRHAPRPPSYEKMAARRLSEDQHIAELEWQNRKLAEFAGRLMAQMLMEVAGSMRLSARLVK